MFGNEKSLNFENESTRSGFFSMHLVFLIINSFIALIVNVISYFVFEGFQFYLETFKVFAGNGKKSSLNAFLFKIKNQRHLNFTSRKSRLNSKRHKKFRRYGN